MRNLAICAQHITVALATVLRQSVSEESVTAVLTTVTGRVVQTLQALACMQITIAVTRQIHIIAAFAFIAGAVHFFRMAKVVVGADVAP